MKITIESTEKIVHVNNVPARIWEGKTENGIKMHCFITRIAIDREDNQKEFQKELESHKVPSVEMQLFPPRIIL